MTCFAVTTTRSVSKGKQEVEEEELLAVGTANLSIEILDDQLHLRARILDAHSFPPTTIAFSPDAQWIVSASADGSLRCIRVPPAASVRHSTLLWMLAILVLLLAILWART